MLRERKQAHFFPNQKLFRSKDLLISESSIKLTQNGFLLADRIASDLFLTHD